jgi:hypothetical protein
VVGEIAYGDPEARRSSMISTHHILRRLTRGIAAVALLAAFAVPAALGSSQRSSGDQDGWYNLAISGDAGQTNAGGMRFITDTLAPGGGVVAVSDGAPGFDWGDAGIGAAGTIGLLLMLLGGTRLASHRRGELAV